MTQTFNKRSTAEQVLDGVNLGGQTVLVTGVNSGIGTETLRVLAGRGAHVIGTGATRAGETGDLPARHQWHQNSQHIHDRLVVQHAAHRDRPTRYDLRMQGARQRLGRLHIVRDIQHAHRPARQRLEAPGQHGVEQPGADGFLPVQQSLGLGGADRRIF